jgi:hypothetical protein
VKRISYALLLASPILPAIIIEAAGWIFGNHSVSLSGTILKLGNLNFFNIPQKTFLLISLPFAIVFNVLFLRRIRLGLKSGQWIPKEFAGLKYALGLTSLFLSSIGLVVNLLLSKVHASSGVPLGLLILFTSGLGLHLGSLTILITEAANFLARNQSARKAANAKL